MEIDRYTKLLLTVIAIALVIIALNPWLTPRVAEADDLSTLESYARRIYSEVSSISSGLCLNGKIC